MGKKASSTVWKTTIPKHVFVGQYQIDVATPDNVTMDNNEVEGRYLSGGSLIEIRTDRSYDCTRDTLMHEVLHAVFDLSGLRSIVDLDKDLEERLIRGLSPALLAVLRDNPRLVDFFLS